MRSHLLLDIGAAIQTATFLEPLYFFLYAFYAFFTYLKNAASTALLMGNYNIELIWNKIHWDHAPVHGVFNFCNIEQYPALWFKILD